MKTTETRDRRIYVNDSGMKKLREIFKVSRVTVWKALTYRTQSCLGDKIRYVALTQLGGVAMPWMPGCETTHEEAAGTMTQTWGGRVKLVFFKRSGDVVIYVDGKKDRELKGVDTQTLIELQRKLELKALTLA